jgi:hypothetical protein
MCPPQSEQCDGLFKDWRVQHAEHYIVSVLMAKSSLVGRYFYIPLRTLSWTIT